MNIIVGFKIVPDDQMVKVVGDKLNTDAPLKVSSYDKNAIEEAIRLKEKFGGKVTADRGMVSYIETVESSLPLVVSVGGEINTPRIPSVKQIMESSKKPVKEVKFDAQSKVRIREIKPMIVNRKRIVIEESDINKAVDKLIEYLKSDGVI